MYISYKWTGFGFALLSLIAIVWQHFGMTRVWRVDPTWSYLEARDDRDVGGSSHSQLHITDDEVRVTCDLRLQYEHAFCELTVVANGPDSSGLDLTGYDRMILALDYTHPGVDRVRVTFRNFNPAYSQPGDISTLQVSEIEYNPSRHPVLEVPLSQFQVAAWWRREMSLPVEHAAPQFDDIVQISIATGGMVVPGEYSIVLRYLELHGKWIEAESLYLALLVAWVLFVLLALFWELQQYRHRLRASHERQAELESINRFLELRSEKLEKLASHDPLTSALNRAGIRDPLLQHISDARKKRVPLSAVFIDIDYFKAINDTHGHHLGDQILVEFAQLVINHIRENDYFARWGGEEFLLLCPDTSLDDATALADQLRVLTAAHEWPHGGGMSASFGVTQFQNEEVAEFLNRADRALYQAKSAGRNRVLALRAEHTE